MSEMADEHEVLAMEIFTILSEHNVDTIGDQRYVCRQIADLSGDGQSQSVHEAAQDFANTLEEGCLKSPFQWFNFYPFWQRANHE